MIRVRGIALPSIQASHTFECHALRRDCCTSCSVFAIPANDYPSYTCGLELCKTTLTRVALPLIAFEYSSTNTVDVHHSAREKTVTNNCRAYPNFTPVWCGCAGCRLLLTGRLRMGSNCNRAHHLGIGQTILPEPGGRSFSPDG